MFEKIFTTVLRSAVIPYIFFLFLKEAFLDEDVAWLAVSLTLSITVAISFLWQAISLLPKLMLLRGNKFILTLLAMGIEVGSVVVFWYYYFLEYA